MIRSMKTELMRRQVRDNLTVLLLFAALLLIQKSISSWQLMNDELEQQALTLTLPLKPALEARDQIEANRCLQVVHELRSMVSAHISTPDNPDFATYGQDLRAPSHTGLSWATYTRSFPVQDEARTLGILTLTRSLTDIYLGIFLHALLILAMGLAVWMVSFIFARSVHETFSASFSNMIQTMKAMQAKPQAPLSDDIWQRTQFEEIQFILIEFQKMTQAIFDRDQRLLAANLALEDKVQERTRELKQLQERLVEEAHKAGMADIAASVLHNFGNILSSLLIDCSILRDMLHREGETLTTVQALELLNSEPRRSEIFQSPQKMQSLHRLFVELEAQARREQKQYHDILERVHEQLYLMKDLIHQQQDFATGQTHSQTVDLRDILEQAFHLQLSQLKAHGITWSMTLLENTAVFVQKTKFLHVFANLVINAIDAMKDTPAPERRIQVAVNLDQDDVLICFRDSGPGMTPEQINRIFTLGFTTKAGGHGYGLHSSANYMREMRGALELEEPQPEAGAGFILRLRRASLAGS